jgi:hypothetical protein
LPQGEIANLPFPAIPEFNGLVSSQPTRTPYKQKNNSFHLLSLGRDKHKHPFDLHALPTQALMY